MPSLILQHSKTMRHDRAVAGRCSKNVRTATTRDENLCTLPLMLRYFQEFELIQNVILWQRPASSECFLPVSERSVVRVLRRCNSYCLPFLEILDPWDLYRYRSVVFVKHRHSILYLIKLEKFRTYCTYILTFFSSSARKVRKRKKKRFVTFLLSLFFCFLLLLFLWPLEDKDAPVLYMQSTTQY